MRKRKIFNFFVFSLVFYGFGNLIITNLSNANIQNKETIVSREYRDSEEEVFYNIETISSGSSHSAAIINDKLGNDYLYVWGSNKEGQLGLGAAVDSVNKPTELFSTNDKYVDIEYISLKETMSSAILLDSSGKEHLYIWGTYQKPTGREKEEKSIKIESPIEVDLVDSNGEKIENIKQLEMGVNFLGVVSDKGETDDLYLVGSNLDREIEYLGSQSFFEEFNEFLITDSSKIKDVSLGDGSTGVVLEYGDSEELYLQGKNDGNLINPGPPSSNQNLTNIDFPSYDVKNIKDIEIGNHNIGVVTTYEDGSDHLITWGDNEYGQLGNVNVGGTILVTVKNDIVFEEFQDEDIEINNFSLGENHTLISFKDMNEKSYVYSWGNNEDGQVGKEPLSRDTDISDLVTTPYMVSQIDEGEISTLDANGEISSVLYTDSSGNDLQYGWGNNELGQLGNGSNESSTSPTLVENDEIISSFVISTKYLDMLSDISFSFLIKTNLVVNPSKIKIYSDETKEVGYVELISHEEDQYTFEAIITETTNTDGIYWSTDGGETLELISSDHFYFEIHGPKDHTNQILFSYLLASILLISIIMVLLFIFLNQRKKATQNNIYLDELITETTKEEFSEEIEEILYSNEDDINNKLEEILSTQEVNVEEISNTKEINPEDFDLSK